MDFKFVSPIIYINMNAEWANNFKSKSDPNWPFYPIETPKNAQNGYISVRVFLTAAMINISHDYFLGVTGENSWNTNILGFLS